MKNVLKKKKQNKIDLSKRTGKNQFKKKKRKKNKFNANKRKNQKNEFDKKEVLFTNFMVDILLGSD